jgi:hypothetical protein
VLAGPVESEFEVLEAATSTATVSADAGATAGGVLASSAVVTEHPTLDQGGDVRGPVPSAVSEAVEGVPGEPATDMESVLVAPPLPIAGVDESAHEGAELSSVQPTATVEGAAPAASQLAMAPQERDMPPRTRCGPPPQRCKRPERALARPYREALRMRTPGSSILPKSRGRPPSRLAMTLRRTRSPRHVIPSSAD